MGKSINWSNYNRSLVTRGSITFWFPEDIGETWYADPVGKRGAQNIYSDVAIEALSMIRFRYGLKLRCTQGFAKSIVDLMGLELEVPDYTTICRRFKKLSITSQNKFKKKDPIHVVIDSTGLKVYGEGEWKVRQHGVSKRRTWRKLHLAVDESNSQILSVVLSENSFKDSELFEDLVDQIDEGIDQISADGAYDSKNCFNKSSELDAKLVVPPRRGARIGKHGNCSGPPARRDEHIREIRRVGRKAWKENNDYYRRSISETAMYRFKSIFGGHLNSREFDRQANEAFIKCSILNRMEVPSNFLN